MLFVVLFAACYWVLLPCLVIFVFRRLLRTGSATTASRPSELDVAGTPLTSEVLAAHDKTRTSCLREYDIIKERHVVTLGNGTRDTLRLPLNACSDAAADAIEAASGRPGFQKSFRERSSTLR